MTARPNAVLDALPSPGERRIAVRTTRDALRQIRGGSPWLYDGSITSVSHEGAPGDLAVVFDHDRRFAAIGLYDPASPIRVKVLHHGSPLPIDHTFWHDRIARALERRVALADDTMTNAYRLIHGENDGMPGFVADRYDDTLVVKLYTAGWFAHLRPVLAALGELQPHARVVLRLGRTIAADETYGITDGDVVVGPPVDGPVRFRERGLAMEADVVRGQKTGHFLDQRDNRVLVRGMAAGCDVLDVFSSTGGFALAAAAGGAASVHLVDQSEPALDTARRNLAHNRGLPEVRRCSVRSTVGDAFDVLSKLAQRAERYDLVVVDPPSFASNQAAVDRALAAYARLTRLALAVTAPGGTLVQASCSSRVSADAFASTVLDAAASARRDVTEIRRTAHAVDHPIGFEYGAYLKAMYLRC